MRRSTAKILHVVAAIIAIVLTLLLTLYFRSKAVVYLVIAIYLPIGIWLNSQLRCRYCGRWPRRGDFFAVYCPGCGKLLDDE